MKAHPVSVALLSAFSLAVGLVVPAAAKDFKMPESKPAISVTFPDSWKPEETDDGVQGKTPDEAVYLAVEATKSEKGMNSIIDSTFEMFKEHKVDVDQSSKKENKFKVAGQDAEEMLFTGKDADGPVAISLTFLTIKDTVVVISYWASTDKVEKHQAAITKIVNSIKAL